MTEQTGASSYFSERAERSPEYRQALAASREQLAAMYLIFWSCGCVSWSSCIPGPGSRTGSSCSHGAYDIVRVAAAPPGLP